MQLSIYIQFLYFCQYYLYNNVISVPGPLVCNVAFVIIVFLLNSSFCILHLSPSLCPVFPQVRQFIVNLDGDVEVEVSSGEKRVITRGQVFFVEDITG